MPIVVNLATIRTLGQLKARIADELSRADLTSQTALAIDDAVSEAAGNRFWFNEVLGLEFSTTAGQAYYSDDDVSALTEIDSVSITVNGQRRNLCQASQSDLNGLANGNPTLGEPCLWTRYGGQLRFDPIPRQSYVVSIDGVSRLSSLVSDGDSNAWTDTGLGERYVRALAKRNLLAEIIQDFDRAQVQAQLADRYKSDLLAQTYDRIATNRMAAYG